jgi:hypothetical protein
VTLASFSSSFSSSKTPEKPEHEDEDEDEDEDEGKVIQTPWQWGRVLGLKRANSAKNQPQEYHDGVMFLH